MWTAATTSGARTDVRILPLLALALCLTGCGLPHWPVPGTLSSPFGLRLRGWRPDIHPGVDIASPEGTPVHAIKHGRVRFAGQQRGYGNVVYLEHRGGTITLYAHLAELRVTTGAQVRRGEVIGTVGRTGNATGAHLHLEIWRGGRPEDPVLLLGGMPRSR